MIVLIVCTEGENSEPNYISALKNVLWGTVPGGNAAVEVVPVPLGGNHGFKKIFEKAESKIATKSGDSESILSVLDESNEVEKWLIVDYDKMYKHGVSEEWMRDESARMGYKLVINKPNFEFFVLAHFVPIKEAAGVAMKSLEDRIDEEIDRYNVERGFDRAEYSVLKLPKYDKNNFQSKDLFWKMLDQDIGLLDIFIEDNCYCDDGHYTEMWKIIERLKGFITNK